ncbi:Putative protein of unknown function [Podospora comata]|uniref:Uncharacterized protein n=1 Tax=Podospora comata TaxID=48703 RepID=A0ABY6RZ91_PODCO|nr:Putative protein of unknown function [Podospora comata]
MPGSSSRTATTVWYCDNCTDGPLNYTVDAYCPSCGHLRCVYCTVHTIKSRG